MSGSLFTPNLKSLKQEDEKNLNQALKKPDAIGSSLLRVAQYAVLLIFGFVSVFFIPGIWASLGFSKVVFTIIMCGLVLIAMSLLALRRRYVKTVLPIPLFLFWGVVAVASLSALLSGDIQDALLGSVLETQTVGFLVVMALAMTVTLILQGSKTMTIKALAVFAAVAGLLLLYNLVRIIFGGEILSLNSFATATTSPIGGFNDLALFAGLTVLLGLITLSQLPLRGFTQAAVVLLVFMSLFVLAVINFFNIWVVIGFFALLLFVYLLSRDTLFAENAKQDKLQPVSRVLLITTAIVCIISAVFIVGGDFAGNKINKLTGIEYIEVKPSTEATIDIAKAVYQNNLVFGAGPNRFSDAWRMHKNIDINRTIFWDTDFAAGSGYVPTLFVTLGAVGAILLVIFHAYFLRLGYRMFLKDILQDSYWYYFGLLSFTGAVFLWGMSYVYVPGVSILLLAALLTGFTFVAYSTSYNAAIFTIPLVNSRQRGFFLMATTIAIITATIGGLFSVLEQYTAQSRFASAQATATSVEELDQAAAAAYELFADDTFLSTRAKIKLTILDTILNMPEVTEEDRQKFVTTAEQAAAFAQQAVQADPTNPYNHAVLANVYRTLAAADFKDAANRANATLAVAQRLDPNNPTYDLSAAQVAIATGNVELAREKINAALDLKRNYTQALYLLAQLDISQGNVESAIATTRSIISLEPNNPTRYFQLGLLLSANDDNQGAIAAFEAAIARDSQYANARYFLALAYVNNQQPQLALEQLEIVQETNQENTELAALIEQIENGEMIVSSSSSTEPTINDTTVSPGENTTVSSGDNLDTDLVTPVNTVPTPNDSQSTESVSDPEVVTEAENGSSETETGQ